MQKKHMKLTLVKSLIARLESHKECARGLGLKGRMNQTVVVEDTPSTRGMVNKIFYLLKIEEV